MAMTKTLHVSWSSDDFKAVSNAHVCCVVVTTDICVLSALLTCFFCCVCWFPDYLHSIPVAQMGNYQEYLKMMPSPLREIDPDQPKRLHTFGNPFKQDKKVNGYIDVDILFINIYTHTDTKHQVLDLMNGFPHGFFPLDATQGMMIDEADEFVAGPQSKKRGHSGDSGSGASMKRRRSMSPLLRRPQTPPGTANHLLAGKGVAAAQGQQGVTMKATIQGKGEAELELQIIMMMNY